MDKIRWTEKASNNLQAIYDYIARDSKVYAKRFIKSLINATEKLKIHPHTGRLVPELESSEIREIIYQNYRLVYRIKNGNKIIEILAVVHSAREIRKILENQWELL